IERIDILSRILRGNRRVGHAQHSTTLISAKLDLPRRMCCQNFVQTEIKILIAKLVHERREVNRASVIDACFVRYGGEWRDLDFASGERFDVQAKQVLDRLERESGAAAE